MHPLCVPLVMFRPVHQIQSYLAEGKASQNYSVLTIGLFNRRPRSTCISRNHSWRWCSCIRRNSRCAWHTWQVRCSNTVQQEYMELSSELNKVHNSSCRAAEGTKTGTRTGALECRVMGDGVENMVKLA